MQIFSIENILLKFLSITEAHHSVVINLWGIGYTKKDLYKTWQKHSSVE